MSASLRYSTASQYKVTCCKSAKWKIIYMYIYLLLENASSWLKFCGSKMKEFQSICIAFDQHLWEQRVVLFQYYASLLPWIHCIIWTHRYMFFAPKSTFLQNLFWQCFSCTDYNIAILYVGVFKYYYIIIIIPQSVFLITN